MSEVISFEKLKEAKEWQKAMEKVYPGKYTFRDCLETVCYVPPSWKEEDATSCLESFSDKEGR